MEEPAEQGGSTRRKVKSAISKVPVAGPAALGARRVVRRYSFALSYYRPQLARIRRWSLLRTEDTNFYYDLTPRNEATLSALVAVVTNVPPAVIEGYFQEVKLDMRLRDHIARYLHEAAQLQDAKIAYGRRLGWYAFIRAIKPRLVVETGVAHGVGACVIASALIRNGQEGFPGRYLGTEIDPQSGALLSGEYASVGHVQYGDSIESLKTIGEPVDIFINDSDHSASYEAEEYAEIAERLAPCSLVLGDNSHVTTALCDWAEASGRPYLFFKEEPADHWYPGAGIGISPSSVPIPSLKGAGRPSGA